jgi:hypothetical protein
MRTRTNRLVRPAVLAVALAAVATTALPMMIPERTAASPAGPVTQAVVDAVVASIDAKRGVLVAAGRTYRFDPAGVGFSDDRRPPLAGGVASLQNGSRVTLRTIEQGGLPRVLHIIAR